MCIKLVKYWDKRQCPYNVTLRRVNESIVALGKKYCIFQVCVCNLKYPAPNSHASYCHLWPVDSTIYFTLSKKAQFSKKKLLNTKCFRFSPQILSNTFLILRRTERRTITSAHWTASKVTAALVIFQWNLNFIDIFYKNNQIQNFMKIRPVGAELFHADGRTRRS